MEELTEKPQHVSVHVLSSTTALMSWTSSQENYNGTIVSVVSLTCQKQKESQRLEKQYCTQVREQEKMLMGLLTQGLQEAIARGCPGVSPGAGGVVCEQEMSVPGSSVTLFLPPPLSTSIFLLFSHLIQDTYDVPGIQIGQMLGF